MGTISGTMASKNSVPPSLHTSNYLIKLWAQKDTITKTGHDIKATQLLWKIQKS